MEAAALLVANVAQTIVVKPATSVVKTLVAQMDLIVAPMVVVASRAITASAAAAVPLERSALATVGSVMIKASRLVLMTTIAAVSSYLQQGMTFELTIGAFSNWRYMCPRQ